MALMFGIGMPTTDLKSLKGIELTSSTASVGQVTVGTTATLIRPENLGRRFLVIVNNSGGSIFIGPDNTVTTTTGLEIPTGLALDLTRLLEGYTGPIYGIASAPRTISYWEG